MLAQIAPLLLFQRLSPKLKFKKNLFDKNFQIKISKICSTVLCVLARRSRVPSFVRIREKL